MQIYAHRAGRGLAPENTLYACHTALQLDIDFIDFDIGMTKDGLLVVTHDIHLNPDITRDLEGKFITQKTPIKELTYKQLTSFNVGQINPSTQYASYFPQQRTMHNAQIPLLQEAIDYVKCTADKPIHFQIEIKTNPLKPQLTASPEEFARTLYVLLKQCNIIQQTEVQSFDYRSLLSLQKLDSRIKTSYLMPPMDDLSQLTQWTAGYDVKNFDNSYLKMIQGLGGSCWGPFQKDVTLSAIEEAKSLGLKVVPWGYPEKEGTEFDQTQIEKLMKWKVDGIITDRPDILTSMRSH